MHPNSASLLLLSLSLTLCHPMPQKYFEERMAILAREASQRVGGHLELSPKEVKVNAILMQEKRREIENTLINGALFPPAVNFMQSKPAYDESKVFKIIKKMPKGAVLHLHEMQAISLDWVVENVTYRPDCYLCTDHQGTQLFRFFREDPKPADEDCQWERVSNARQRSGNERVFNERIYESMSLKIPNSTSGYVNNRQAWQKFSRAITAIDGLLSFVDVTKDRLYETLREARDDNVMYMELRGIFPAYNLDGDTLNREWVVEKFIETVTEFRRDYPDFIGAKYIGSGRRTSTNAEMKSFVEEMTYLHLKYPDVVVGMDISTDEDRGKPNVDFVNEFLQPSTSCPPVDLPYFFHAGETDWIGTRVDADILDAILLGTRRIGHGFALHGHPEFLRLVKEKDIAIEVNPISNQEIPIYRKSSIHAVCHTTSTAGPAKHFETLEEVFIATKNSWINCARHVKVLSLIRDLRVHPAVSLLAQNYTIVIGSDDPNCYDSLPASYDYYAAFMALGGAEADLRFLKQLVINSFMYSAMMDEEKSEAINLWKHKWDIFITDINTEWSNNDSSN